MKNREILMNQTNFETQNSKYKITEDTILFFDLDGTLVDTNYANFLSYNNAIKSVTKSELDLTFNPDNRFNRILLKSFVPDLNEKEYERIIQEKEKSYKDFLHATKLIKPVSDILLKYSETNRTILVTNCRQIRAQETLEYHGLTTHFEKFFFRKFSLNGTHTNKFKNAISELGISTELVIAFENEKTEIEDAIKAGIPNQNIIRI